MNDDATQPRRADVFPPDYDFNQNQDDDSPSGPGCLVWSIMGVFGIIIAIAIVLTAIFAGFNDGLQTAQVTSAAATSQNISRQCTILPTDIAAQRFEIVENRFDVLTVDGVLAPCAEVFVPQATIAFEQSLPTATQLATATATLPPSTDVPEATAEIIAEPTSDSPFDLDALFLEAQGFIAAQNYEDAISTLDAIIAIDDSYRSQEVSGLLFNSLVERARILYRTEGGSLQEAILLTGRAEEFGNIQTTDLPFERSVAQLYIDALPNLNINYQLAIQLLNQVINLSPNYPRSTGEASTLLFEQTEAYGDALLLGGDPCGAEGQFTNALALRPNNPSLQAKVDNANQQCQFGVPATIDPDATVDPNAPAVTPTEGVAPVGQPGG